ncbi:hypothetical protein GALL_103990 [mine drainage metagenome]|uniref:Tetratricopeptide repeat protein n=1 Tax=mine drainage metagenome TaxID=410659 RepID=A0A1J5STT7_9ZZZZ
MATPELSLYRRLAYSAMLVVFTLAVLLGGTELALRLGGYGASPHFARRAALPGGGVVIRENLGCTVPFFSPALARRPEPFRLEARKPPGTVRIFVLGSSAAMGDPEPSFSLSRVLGVMLRASWPGTRFEVVNAGITAINSNLLRGYAADCAELQPDLFVVYEGQNEVIGPFGPSGVFAPFLRSEAAVRFGVWAKGTRTGQLISAIGRRLAWGRGVPKEWGGMRMFLNRRIPEGDPSLRSVAGHFRANLRAIAASAHGAGAETLLCTVVTNQRDFAPFMSEHRPGLSPNQLAAWKRDFQAGAEAERAGDASSAEIHYRSALAIDDRYAELVFRLGRIELALGRDYQARALLSRARDLDTLRFRTDSRLNDVIREVGTAGLPGVALVDLAHDLAARSAHGIPGDEFLYEHVHLTLRGTYEAALALYPAIAADLERRGLVKGPSPEPISYASVRDRLAFTVYEQAMIGINLLNRFRGAPFTGQSDDAYRIALWQRRVNEAEALLRRPDAVPALTELYRQALAQSPGDWVLERNAGAMLVANHRAGEALPLLEKAEAWIGDDIDTLVALGWAQRGTGHEAAAEATFARARRISPDYPGLPPPH